MFYYNQCSISHFLASLGAQENRGDNAHILDINGCGHTWDLTLVKGFNRGKKDVKNFTIVKLIT